MSDDEAFLRGICENADDDVPRLVYADWLDEQDTEKSRWRASMIRGNTDPYGPQRWRTTFPDVADFLHNNRLYALWIDGVLHNSPDIQSSQHDTEPAIYIRRGFVAEIRCSLADFMGRECECEGAEPCQICNGIDWVEHPNGGVVRCPNYDETDEMDGSRCCSPCTNCDGTGTLPGLARTMFKWHPITEVVLTDLEPMYADEYFFWHTENFPMELAPYLPGDPDMGYPQDGLSSMDAASIAAVNYARKMNGYKPLKVRANLIGN